MKLNFFFEIILVVQKSKLKINVCIEIILVVQAAKELGLKGMEELLVRASTKKQ